MAIRTIPFLSTTPGASMHVMARTVWAKLQVMVHARATRRLLAEMDPRMLADIGVSRGAAHQEADRPFWDLDPRR